MVVVYYVVCFFLVLLLRVSSDNVAFVRIRSTTSVCLLHGLVLLPRGISGKMTIPSKSLLSLLASLLSLLLCHDTYHLLYHASHIARTSLYPTFLANRCLAMLPLCSAPPIALLVVGEVEDCPMMDRIML